MDAQFSSVTQSCLNLCDPMDCSSPGLPVYHQLLEFTQTHVHQVSDAIQPSHPLSSPSPPAFNLSQHQGLFKWVSSSHQMAKILEFHFQHQSFQWIFRTDFLRVDWLDLLAVQGTLKSLLQHCSSALIRQTLFGKVMSLLFNMLSSLVVAFLPRSKCLLISWLPSPSAEILEPPKIKSDTVPTVFPSI